MITLGDVLSCAFDSPSGVPHDWVDPALCQSDKGTQNTIAGAGTMILEFARLSDITGDQKYVELAQKAENYLLEPQPASGEPYPGLLGSFISVENGQIIGSQGSWGALADCKTCTRYPSNQFRTDPLQLSMSICSKHIYTTAICTSFIWSDGLSRRTRRFSSSDHILMGIRSGLSYHLGTDPICRMQWNHYPGSLAETSSSEEWLRTTRLW